MDPEDSIPTRPISVAIPGVGGVQGPYCPRRPNLREILANTSPPPWTLTAFMAYLSNNHCLETLEFTMDAGRYRKHYAKMMSRSSGPVPPSKDREYVQALWQRLVDAYIRPNGSREVNLPSDVRDAILELKPDTMPPAPDTLDAAVGNVYELMEESVLVPFLNSAYPQTTGSAAPASWAYSTSDDSPVDTARALEDRSSYSRRRQRHSPTPQSATHLHAHSYSLPSTLSRHSPSSTLPVGRVRLNARPSPTTSAPSASGERIDSAAAISDTHLSGSGFGFGFGSGSGSGSGSGLGPGMTDDSGSADSPTGESPMTPPTTPPMGDGSLKRDSGVWKKFGRMSGMRVGKKKSRDALREEQ